MEEDQTVQKGVYILRGSLRYREAGFLKQNFKNIDAEVNWEQVELFEDDDLLCG